MQHDSRVMGSSSRSTGQATNEQVSDDDSLDSMGLYEEQAPEVLHESSVALFGADNNPARSIREALMERGRLVSMDGTKYMYISEDMGWVPITSGVARKEICKMEDIYAPVNYIIATDPIVEGLISSESPPVIYGPTFCQGAIRCNFATQARDSEGRTTVLSLAPALPHNVHYTDADIKGAYTAKMTNCTCPMQFKRFLKTIKIPRALNMHKKGYLCRWIHDVFEESAEAILWIIGDIMANYGNKRMFMLYGPANTGKSTVVNIITSLVSFSPVNLIPMLLAKDGNSRRSYGNTIPAKFVAELASTRLVLSGDLEVTDASEHLNMQTIKEITGGDQGPNGCISVTILTCVNKLFTYEFMEDFTASDRTRRVNVIPTVHRRKCRNEHPRESTDQEKSELVSLALATRYRYDRPLLTTLAVLMTLFQAKFNYALSIVCIDDDTTVVENYVATRVLCYKFNIHEGKMMECLRTIGCKCTKTFIDVPVIANICLKHKAKVYREKSRLEVERQKAGFRPSGSTGMFKPNTSYS